MGRRTPTHPDGARTSTLNNVARLTFESDDFEDQIQEETGIRPSWSAEAFSDVDEDVRQSIARVKASPFLPHRDDVRGFVYEVETGRLREVA